MPPRAGAVASAGVLVAFLAIAAAVAGVGAWVTVRQVDGWYSRVPHVTWTPPNAAFGLVWSVLYVLIAVTGWLLWRRRQEPGSGPALSLYVVQLVVNAVWAPLFFGGYPTFGDVALWASVAVILLLDLLVVATVAVSWPVSRAAAVLLLPYLAWILYASTLNWGDAILIAVL